MHKGYQMYPVKVTNIEVLTPLIKRFTFTLSHGGNFPSFTGGSHIIVQMEGKGQVYNNAYSLTSSPSTLEHYQVCVRMDEQGKGGSKYLHQQITIGSRLVISEPKNLFALPPLSSSSRHVLIAGGIGITPFIQQLEELAAQHSEYALHYAFRSPEQGVFWQELQHSKHADHCQFYIDSEGSRLDLSALIFSLSNETHLHLCGPATLIEAALSCAMTKGLPASQIHVEQFTALSSTQDQKPFTVVLAKTGIEIHVAADQTLLQALESTHVDIDCLCREGVCGTCETAVLEGEIEHLDQYLSADEKAAQKSMMVCVSRAKHDRLVLDL